jgi:hypothetical protein
MTETITATAHTIYASFPEAAQAERAAGALLDSGVRAEDISIVSTEAHAEYLQRMDDFTAEGAPAPFDDEESQPVADPWYVPTVVQDYPEAHAPSTLGISITTSGDAAAGAAKGAGIGLGFGALAALSCMAVPGVGLIVGGGMLATAIACAAGATAAGAVAGGIHGFLVDQGIPNEAVERYSEAYHAGDTILAVTCPSNGVNEYIADQVLTKYHGNHISSYHS